MTKEYRQSNLKHYFKCPKRFELSLKHNIPETQEMWVASTLKKWLLNFKNNEQEGSAISQDAYFSDSLKESIDKCLSMDILPRVKLSDLISQGECYYKQSFHNYGMDYIISGESDLFHEDFGFFVINFTDDLHGDGWGLEEVTPSERLQAIVYPYIYYKNYQKIMDFEYIIIEIKYDTPIIKSVRYTPTYNDFKEFEKFLLTVNASSHEPNSEHLENCFEFKKRCPFFEKCAIGRDLLGKTVNLKINSDFSMSPADLFF